MNSGAICKKGFGHSPPNPRSSAGDQDTLLMVQLSCTSSGLDRNLIETPRTHSACPPRRVKTIHSFIATPSETRTSVSTPCPPENQRESSPSGILSVDWKGGYPDRTLRALASSSRFLSPIAKGPAPVSNWISKGLDDDPLTHTSRTTTSESGLLASTL